jgi:hypothetical protein
MLHLLDEVLETHLRNTVPLDRAIDVSFAIPDREWSTGLARPTISAYLWDIKRDDKRNVGGVELVNRGTTKMRRLVSPRVRVSYFLSVFTGDQRDEHVLLGRLLQGVMKSREISQDIIPVGLTTPGARIELAIGGGTAPELTCRSSCPSTLDWALKRDHPRPVSIFVQQISVNPREVRSGYVHLLKKGLSLTSHRPPRVQAMKVLK